MVGVLLAAFCLCACGRAPSDETPAGAVSLFLRAMSDTDWDDGARQTAYHLLSRDDREVLAAKAARATALAGREFQPWEMIVEGRYRAHFHPNPKLTKESIERDHATVILRSGRREDHAKVPLIREEGRWRIVLGLPAPAGEP